MFHRHRATALAFGAIAFCTTSTALRAQTLEELNAQIESLRKQLSEIERRQSVEEKAAVTAGSQPGSFKLPGSGTSIRLGGYVKLDAIYSSRSAGIDNVADQLLLANAIPVGPNAGANEKGQLKLHARETRLNVRTETPTAKGLLTTYVEGDFFGADGNETATNAHGIRLRHAWATLGNFGFGQYWTNFMDVPALAETLDFGGAVGTIFARQAQVRWTEQTVRGEWAISLENPESIVGVPHTSSTFRADDDRYPDMAASVSTKVGATRLWSGALVRNVRVDSAADPVAVDDKWGAALAFSAIVPTFGKDDLRLFAYGGNAVGRYQPIGFFVDGVLDDAGHLALPKVIGGYAAYRHFWSPNLRSTLMVSSARADNPAATAGGLNRSASSAHLNLIWSPIPVMDVGIEYIAARREIENGDSGTLNRMQFSAKYAF